MTVNSKNLYYIKDATNTYNLLIDTGAGISIFKENVAQKFPHRSPENVTIQGITDQKLLISESTLVPFALNNPHKVFIYNLDIDFDGILGLDFLEHYECVIDLKNKELKTNFKTMPLYKVDVNFNANKQVHLPPFKYNEVLIEGRTEKVFKLKCDLFNTDAILSGQEIDKVRLPHAIVKVNGHGEFLTSIINANAIPKTIDFSNLSFEPLTLDPTSNALFNFHSQEDNASGPADRIQVI